VRHRHVFIEVDSVVRERRGVVEHTPRDELAKESLVSEGAEQEPSTLAQLPEAAASEEGKESEDDPKRNRENV